jgi:5-methylcytosine-specific restriction endonuclease McrA
MTDYNSRAWHRYFDRLIAAQGGVRCSRCPGFIGPGDPYHVDHLVEAVRGGTSTAENLWPCHPRCNMRAGSNLGRARKQARRSADSGFLGL